MHKACALLFMLMLGMAQAPALADDAASDAAIEARVHALSATLRCLVCQNQSVAESDSEFAGLIRQQLREQLRAGKSEAEIDAYVVARYGETIRYRPAFQGSTLLLWIGPFLLLVIGFFGLRRALGTQQAITTEDGSTSA